MVTRAMIVVVALACASTVHAQDAVSGLLAMPGLFGRGACERFEPAEVTVHASPEQHTPIASIRVDRHWTFADGGCDGLEVNVHDVRTGRTGALPTREFDYENPAAMVVETRGDWYRIRLDQGTGWISATADAFHPIERLLLDGLTYLTGAWSGAIVAAPGDAASTYDVAPGYRAVRVLAFSRIADRPFVEVEVLSSSPCDGDEPDVVVRGWLPLYDGAGEPTVWFHSRGC